MQILQENDFFHSRQHAFCLFLMNKQLIEGVHGHDFDEIVIVREGSGFHIINDTVQFICQGDFFLVTTSDTHSYISTNNLSIINILIRRTRGFNFLQGIDELLGNIATGRLGNGGQTLCPMALTRIERWCKEVIARNEYRYDSLYFLYVEARFINIINELCDTRQHKTALSREEKGRASLIKTLKLSCFRHLDWHALSEECGIARRTMFRFIKRVTGYTPMRFQLLYRILKAQELLRTTDKTVGEIAVRCGFPNTIRLTEAYKRHFKYSPTHERELHSRF